MPLKSYVLIRCYRELLIRYVNLFIFDFIKLIIKLIFSLFTSTFKLKLIEHLSTALS